VKNTTVLLPVYNGQEYIGESIASILCQSLEDFELLVVDDGSIDQTAAIVGAISDPRLRYLRQAENRGLIEALNYGLERISTPYTARMDADDIAHPDRLARQEAFLEAHPEIGVVGSAITLMGDETLQKYPVSDSRIRVEMLFNSPFAHPSVMYRTDLVRAVGYDARCAHAEDFKLWADLAARTKFANLSEPLVRYRLHPGQISSLYAARQLRARTAIVEGYLTSLLGAEPTAKEREAHLGLIGLGETGDIADIEAWIGKLRGIPSSRSRWEEGDFERFVANRLLLLLKGDSERRLAKRIARRIDRILSR
jgi:glycosyltransferase involved in cell wall biosynthesis